MFIKKVLENIAPLTNFPQMDPAEPRELWEEAGLEPPALSTPMCCERMAPATRVASPDLLTHLPSGGMLPASTEWVGWATLLRFQVSNKV